MGKIADKGEAVRNRGSVSDELSIRFVNTMAWRLREPSEERLPSSKALLDWFSAVGLADPNYSARIEARWRKHPHEAQSLYEEAIMLRESVYQLFQSRLATKQFSEQAMKALNLTLGASAPGLRVASIRNILVWQTTFRRTSPADLLKPIAWSAADLLTGPRAQKIRQCQDDRGCGWLFVDESRAQNRRWCSMGDCGNRAKARRHYLRRRRVSSPSLQPNPRLSIPEE
jgi:predicted RNA-binding Zn ribbon-like protein